MKISIKVMILSAVICLFACAIVCFAACGNDCSGATGCATDAGYAEDSDAGTCKADQHDMYWEVMNLADSMAACDTDADCVYVDVGTDCYPACGTGINAASKDEYLKQRQRISDKWCTETYVRTCGVPADSCAQPSLSCKNNKCS